MSSKPFNETKIGKFLKEKVKPIAGDVLEVVGDITGIDAIERVGSLINQRKEESAEMMALHIEFEKYKLEWELELQKLELEGFKAEAADRDSARNREIEVLKASNGKRDVMMISVVSCALFMYIAAFAFLAWGPEVADGKKDLFNMACGQVFTFAGMAFAYYLGTTRNSKQKDEVIKNLSK